RLASPWPRSCALLQATWKKTSFRTPVIGSWRRIRGPRSRWSAPSSTRAGNLALSGLVHRLAAVDVDRLPGHEIARGRGEEHHRPHQVGRHLHALDRPPGDTGGEIVARRRRHLRLALGIARGDGVDGNAELADLVRE